jgi:type IV secretory pathway VirB2 component (pilin)
METQEALVQPSPSSQTSLKLSWREKYAGILVLILGFIYLAAQVSNFTASKAEAYAVKDGALQVSTSELVNDVRTILTILLAILGGWLLLKGKRAGWVMGLPILVLITLVAASIVISSFSIAGTAQRASGLSFLGLLLLAILFLLLPSARRKYKVGKLTYLPTLLILLGLAVLYFFL